MIGITGLAMMFNPSAFDWTNRDAVLGNGLLLLSALAWSVSILYTRAHHWIATPFQLVFWQALLATILLTILALIIEGGPESRTRPHLKEPGDAISSGDTQS